MDEIRDYIDNLIFQIRIEIEYRLFLIKENWLEYLFYLTIIGVSILLIWRHIQMCYIMPSCWNLEKEEKELCYVKEKMECWSEVHMVSNLLNSIFFGLR
jgi:hypothetical protein